MVYSVDRHCIGFKQITYLRVYSVWSFGTLVAKRLISYWACVKSMTQIDVGCKQLIKSRFYWNQPSQPNYQQQNTTVIRAYSVCITLSEPLLTIFTLIVSKIAYYNIRLDVCG